MARKTNIERDECIMEVWILDGIAVEDLAENVAFEKI